MSELNQIWLAPTCHEDGDGRLWCQDDVWGDDCGCGIEQHSAVRYVIATDYDRDVNALSDRNDALEFQAAHNYEVSQLLLTERDELRVQVEAMRAILSDSRRYVEMPWPDGAHSYRENCISGDLLGRIDAALQANHDCPAALLFFLASLFRSPPNRASKTTTYIGGEHGQ